MENLEKLVMELCKITIETPWLEFKHNNYDPEMIGKDICALANGATLHDKQFAYMLWGIDDSTHEIIGTDKNLQNIKKGNQELESWLRTQLSTNANFEFHHTTVNNNPIGVLIIYKAVSRPIMFEKIEYIRVGSYTKKLNDHPELASQLWDKLKNNKFEEDIAKSDLGLADALNLLDYSCYFDLMNESIPSDHEKISHYLLEEGIIAKQDNALYSITNLGAILFAKRLDDFPKLSRKAIRIAQYKGNSKIDLLKEYVGHKGYAVGFEGMLSFIEALLPSREVIDGALRKTETAYPSIAIREVVANAIIHQDFSTSGTSPIIEIFESKIETTNPGTPLIDIYRIIDNPPRSRNEKLASLMRRMHICEELGTGWDKIIIACELQKLPAPKITIYEDSTRVTLFSEKPFTSISHEDKIWSLYLHACIKYVQNEPLTNTSLRNRFGVKESSSASISRLIADAVSKKLIKPIDPDTAPRYMKYIPIWA